MKKALISGKRILEVADAEFPAHPDLLWVDVADDTVAGADTYVNGAVVKAPPNPPPSQDQIDAAAARSYAKLNALKNMTPAQVQAFVQANVTNLAQAQDAIMTLAVAVSILARRI